MIPPPSHEAFGQSDPIYSGFNFHSTEVLFIEGKLPDGIIILPVAIAF
jgi:hypothetical protein